MQPMTDAGPVWNREGVKKLIESLIKDGASNGYIAASLSKQFNTPVTRSAVAGYLHRNADLCIARPLKLRLKMVTKRGPVHQRNKQAQFTPEMDAVIVQCAQYGFANRPAYVVGILHREFNVRFTARAITNRMNKLNCFTPDLRARLPNEQERRKGCFTMRDHNTAAPAHLLTQPVHVTLDDTKRSGVLMSEAKQGQCRWPVRGYGEHMRVCGEQTPAGKSYCLHHALRAHGKASPQNA